MEEAFEFEEELAEEMENPIHGCCAALKDSADYTKTFKIKVSDALAPSMLAEIGGDHIAGGVTQHTSQQSTQSTTFGNNSLTQGSYNNIPI